MDIKVSIVTISFNQANYLEEAILSVLQQDYPYIEYIVVDPGSSDASREIIERYRHRISKVVFDADCGPSEGLNHGFEFATGTVFAYLNADDVLLQGAVSSAIEAFEDADLAVVYGDGYFTDSQGQTLRRCFSTNFSVQRYALGSATIMQQSSFWRREWHLRVGGFNVHNRTCWDGEFFFTIALRGGKFRHIRAYWSYFRIHGQSITGGGRIVQEYLAYRTKMLAPHLIHYGAWLPLRQRVAQLMRYVEDPRILAWRIVELLSSPPAP